MQLRAELGRDLLHRRGLVVGDERLLEHDHVGVVEAAQHLDEVVGRAAAVAAGLQPRVRVEADDRELRHRSRLRLPGHA